MQKLKVGDQVKVITGAEKGKITKIKSILRKKGKVVLENTNIKIKHTKPQRSNEAGKIVQFEAPISISNVMICNNEGIVSRIGIVFENDKKRRKPKKATVTL
jgi:large subunit ribosomal protein L24